MQRTIRRTRLVVTTGLFILLPVVGRIEAATTPDDLCTGNPCDITQNFTFDDPQTVLDFGSRDVNLEGTLSIADNTLLISARNFAIRNLGRIQGSTGDVTIDVEDSVSLDGTRDTGTVRLVGSDGGSLTLTTESGSVQGSGRILLNGNASAGDGGSLTIESAGEVHLSGPIEAMGGNQAGGGCLDLIAGGNVSLTGGVDLSGGEDGGGFLDLTVAGSVILGALAFDGSGELGDAGEFDCVATGDVRFEGTVQGRGSAAGADECGEGGVVDVFSDGTVTFDGEVDLKARAGDCCGGALNAEAQQVTMNDAVSLNGNGGEGGGGSLAISALQGFSCAAFIDVTGPDFGGDVFVEAGTLHVRDVCELRVNGPGGSTELIAESNLAVDGALRVGAAASSISSTIDLAGCDIFIGSAASIVSVGPSGDNTLTGFGLITVAGNMTAGRRNVISFPIGFDPVLTGSIAPAPVLDEDPSLQPCVPLPTPTDTATATITPTTSVPTSTPTPTDTPTASATVESTATMTPSAPDCTGDCNGDGRVDIAELVTGIGIGLGQIDLSSCPAIDRNDSGTVEIDEPVAAVGNSLGGCPN